MADPKNPGPEIDTGTGGFKAEGVSDKRQTFDVGLTDADVSNKPDWSPGQVNVDNTVRDLTPGTKKTLASYLSKTTLGQTPSAGATKPNKYAINHGDEAPNVGKLKDANGYVAPLDVYDSGNAQPHFADVVPGDSRSQYVKMQRGQEAPPLGGESPDGNTLLRKAVDILTPAQYPPPRGTVNVSKLNLQSPVKTYTDLTWRDTSVTPGVFSAAANVLTPSVKAPEIDQTRVEYAGKVTKGELPSSPTSVDNAYPITGAASVLNLKNQGYSQNLTAFGDADGQVRFAKLTPGDSRKILVDMTRGREKPTDVGFPDGNKLISTAVFNPGGQNPPPKGTVNMGSLNPGPVKTYTAEVLKTTVKGVLTVDQLFSSTANVKTLSTPVPSTDKLRANYPSKMTKGEITSTGATKPNKYPLENSDAVEPTKLNLKTEGYVTPLSVYGSGNPQPHFADAVPGDSRSNVQLTSEEITRGQQKPSNQQNPAPDGNVLLKSAIDPSPGAPNPPLKGTVNTGALKDGPVKTYTARVLQTVVPGVLTVDKLFSATSNSKTVSTPVPTTDAGKANYLSKVTKGDVPSARSSVDNFYPIENSPDQPPTAFSITDAKGYPAALTVIQAPQKKFSDISTGRSNIATVLNILRGRQEPGAATVDGNALLIGSMKPTGGASPPAAGTVNVGTLDSTSPVKTYTDEAVKANEYGVNAPFISPANATFLRPADKIDTEPYNGFGPNPQDSSGKKQETLRKYLSGMTKTGEGTIAGNVFTIDESPETESLLTTEGKAQRPHESANTSKFISTNKLRSRSSQLGRPFGLARDSEFNGHKVLLNVTGDVENSDLNPGVIDGKLPSINTTRNLESLKDYSNSVTKNRFNVDNPFASYDVNGVEKFNTLGYGTEPGLEVIAKTSGLENFSTFQFSHKYKLGSYDTADGGARNLSYGRLAQLGPSLTLAASTEISSDPGENPTDGAADASSWLPGWGQLGVERLVRSELNASRYLEELASVPDIDNALITNPAGKSWGALNNLHDKFGGFTNIGMQLLAVALLIAFTVIIAILTGLFLLITPGADARKTKDGVGRRPLGSYFFEGGADYNSIGGIIDAIASGNFNLWRMIGLPPTQYPYGRALPAGAGAFFNVYDPVKDEVSVGKGLVAMSASPGYYSIVGRLVSRSFLLIGDAFADVGSAFAAANPASGIAQIFGLFGVLRESKFIKTLAIFLRLGDAILREYDGVKANSDLAGGGAGRDPIDKVRAASYIDNAENSNRVVLKNRLKDGGLRLAWSSYRAPDLFIMPDTVKNVPQEKATSLQVPSLLPRVPSSPAANDPFIKYGGVYVTTTDGRIPTEVREKLEDALETEYMPFYLHDLRTNEIVSFHAFLASLSDDYTAAYDSVDAYGRVEPIKTYKGTTRKIGFSFYIAATSPLDFNSMWLKINKLTTLVYPQFDEGRRVSTPDGSYSFNVPFSQTIQAAPMVRLRIGDLIKSNNSKFNLARLFGYMSPGTKFDNAKGPGNLSAYQSQEETAAANKAAREKSLSAGNFFTANAPLDEVYVDAGLPIPIPSGGSVSLDKGIIVPDGLALKYVKSDTKTGKHVLELVERQPGDIPKGYPDTDVKSDVANYNGTQRGEKSAFLGKKFLFSGDSLIALPSTEEKIRKETEAQNAAPAKDYTDKVLDFMDDSSSVAGGTKGNAISRAFRSAGGKGLAGFIESMSFDWYDRVTWEIGDGVDNPGPSLGRRAPKMCKVTISFSPVHDIAPGLDAFGANRAAIYPVGSHGIDDIRRVAK